jgi:hypothetical protein
LSRISEPEGEEVGSSKLRVRLISYRSTNRSPLVQSIIGAPLRQLTDDSLLEVLGKITSSRFHDFVSRQAIALAIFEALRHCFV